MGFLSIIQAGAYYGFLLLIPYCILQISYLLLFHPLARYPGPFLAKITDAYGGFYAFRKSLHSKTRQDHQKYGSVIRQGPNKLVFNSIQAINDIYQNDRVLKSPCYQDANMDPATTNVFNELNPQIHRFKRKLVGQLVTGTSVSRIEPMIAEQADLFVKQISTSAETKSGLAANISPQCKYFGLDIAALMAFGYPLHLQTDDKHRYLIHAIPRGSWIINLYMQFRLLKTVKFGIPIYLPALMRGEAFLPTLRKMISARLAEDRFARVDLYSHLADALDGPDDNKITLKELWSEAIFFLPAAGDTSSTALSALFFYLARNPECQRKLAEEIRSTFAMAADIRGGPKLSGCHYLHACINEALRMSPPVAGTLWREQSSEDAGKPFLVDGHIVPAGTKVGVNIYSIHYNAEYFPDPSAYKPQRWLEGEPEASRSSAAAFIPFSIGARGCAGKPLAYMEIGMAMAKTLWYFDFKLEHNKGPSHAHNDVEFRLQDVFTSDHDGPYIRFLPRDGPHKELRTR